MDPVRNPYAPGAGRPPAALVGRDPQLRAWAIALARLEEDRGAQPLALTGLRGVGKTVLLGKLAAQARERGWIVAQVEAGAGRSLRQGLAEALHAPLVELATPSAGKRLLKALRTALSFQASIDSTGTWTFGVDLSKAGGGGADSGAIELDLTTLTRDLADAAAERGAGLAIVIDEAQDLAAQDMVAVCAAAHAAGQQGLPFLLAIGGLPSLPGLLAEARSYAERLFDYHRIDRLPPALAAQALVEPARGEGVDWEPAAVALVVGETGGYPYFLQQLGQEAWNAATGERITLADADVGTSVGLGKLDDGFFRSRWERATRAEQEYLRAMASDDGETSASAEVAARLGRSPQSLGPTRARLIGKGIVYSPGHGRVAFTVPGMAEFIRRRVPQA